MVKFFAVALIFLTAATIVWALAYPSENDPKNIKYVLSKRRLYLMNLDRAMGAMVGPRPRHISGRQNESATSEGTRIS
jgi:hypothetical protein